MILMKKELLDPATGEVVEVLMIGKNPAYKDKSFTKFFVSFLQDVVQDEEVAGKAIRLLLYMIEKLDWNTLEVIVFPKQVIKELNISKMTYFRWLRTLLEKGYIVKIDRYQYKLRPYSVVKGSMYKVDDTDF